MLNKGESCICKIYIPKNTVKIIFDEAVVKSGTAYKKSAKTKKINGIKVTKLPATFSKVKFTKASITKTSYSTTLKLTYKNGTGKAMSGLSSVLIKCYNEDGQVVASGYKYLESLNNGETTSTEITISDSTAEVYLIDVNVYEGEETGTVKTHEVDGIETNVTPYKKDGLTIESISFDKAKATLKITNNTGKNIRGISGFDFKSYNADGEVIENGTFFVQDMNAGETCIRDSYVGSSSNIPAKVVFDTVSIVELDEKIPSPKKLETVGNLKINKMPYSVDGLKIEYTGTDSHYYNFVMSNNTGKAVKLCGILYRAFDKDGCVVDDGKLYGEPMDDGEKSVCKLISDDNWAKVEFYGTTQYEGVKFGNIKTAKIDDIVTNKVPYSNDKLKITDISFEKKYSSFDATVVVQNNTGADIKSSDYIWYKCYDKDGNVIEGDYKYAPAIPKGESASISISYLPAETAKVLFQIDLDK